MSSAQLSLSASLSLSVPSALILHPSASSLDAANCDSSDAALAPSVSALDPRFRSRSSDDERDERRQSFSSRTRSNSSRARSSSDSRRAREDRSRTRLNFLPLPPVPVPVPVPDEEGDGLAPPSGVCGDGEDDDGGTLGEPRTDVDDDEEKDDR
mmetsp:Transcript_17241/g.50049  ORF Transcript_17241/g.50049 Transcript_17241/m.50049 type:complete len:154 (-) Transcript_17241:408-869(-)